MLVKEKEKYLTTDVIKWAMRELQELPKNQLLLIFLLALGREPVISRAGQQRGDFQIELERYLGGPIVGGGTAIFNPLENEWRSEGYFQSTVVGRLLNGGHGWTGGQDAYISRKPARGWPAKFTFGPDEMKNLKSRQVPPSLKSGYRLPPTALAIWYFKFDELSQFNIESLDDLRNHFLELITKANRILGQLFEKDERNFWGDFFQAQPLSEKEKIACFPPAPYSAEPQRSVSLYFDDIARIKKLKSANQSVADFIKNILKDIKE
jgi:hypothetical protein